ncbi:hypothetical protein [Ekhidna sp.]|uniref:hypothetical protein n=1 Tax=Ekhidna sp. TaxID=2608089 RepID=UPI0032981B9A
MKKYKLTYSIIIVILSVGFTSCNGDIQECYDDWKICQGECPEVDQQVFHRCVAGCGNILAPDYQDCYSDCVTAHLAKVRSRDNCLSTCDDQVGACLGVED